MDKKIRSPIVIFLLLILFSGIAHGADDGNLQVKFSYQGKKFLVQGRQVRSNTYIFNEGAKKKITIVTLDWPPYIDKKICRQGWVQQLTIALLASRGYEVTSTFYPWARAVREVETGKADVLYPEYFIEPSAPSDIFHGKKRLDNLELSGRFPGGPIAFIKRKGETDAFKGNLHNLKGEKIGVVRGYQNTPEFDRLMDQNFFSISEAASDEMNVAKLVNKRVNLIIGDPFVIKYSVNISKKLSKPEKERYLNSIEVVLPIIKYNYLYYAVSKKRPGWQEILGDLNKALEQFEKSGEMMRIIHETIITCHLPMEPSLP